MKKLIIGTMVAAISTFVLQDKLVRSDILVVDTLNMTGNYAVKNFSTGRSRANGNRATGSSIVTEKGCSAVLNALNSALELNKCN